jgi:hypothetical protein
MRVLALFGLCCLTTTHANARAVIVWFAEDLPTEASLRFAESLAGSAVMVVAEMGVGAPADAVARGVTTGFSEPLKRVLVNHGLRQNGEVYVAVEQEGRVTVLPYAYGASLEDTARVKWLSSIALQLEAIDTPLFDGTETAAPLVGSELVLDVVFGFGAAMLSGGVVSTPGYARMTEEEGDGMTSSDFAFQLHAGLGFYVLRPSTKGQPAMSVMATTGFDGPAHHTVGGLISYSHPMGPRSWLRLGLSAAGAQNSLWSGSLKEAHLIRGGMTIGLQRML